MKLLNNILLALSLALWGYLGWRLFLFEPTPPPRTAPAPVRRLWEPALPEEPPFEAMPRRAMEPDIPRAHDPRIVDP